MIEPTVGLIIFIIGVALFFDFTNGFHDSANSISTVVSTKVLSPRNAVMFAAFFNFIAAFIVGVAVANTISKIIQLEYVSTDVVPFIILAALIGAIIWNLITWRFGLPTSSSHALIGGLMGAGLSAAGLAAIKWSAIELIVVFMVVSPLIGLACGFLFMVVVLNITKDANKSTADGYFRRLQLVSAAAYSFSHGTNDAQKTIGIILPLLYSIGFYSATVDPNHLPVPCMGDPDFVWGNCSWHTFRRMANCQNDGLQNYPAPPCTRFCCRDGGSRDDPWCFRIGYTGEYNAYYLNIDHGSRVPPWVQVR